MIDKNGKSTTLQAGDLMLFDVHDRLWVIRPKDNSCLRMNDEDEKLSCPWNNHDLAYRSLMIIIRNLFNLDLQVATKTTIEKIKKIKKSLPINEIKIDFVIEVI